MSDRCPLDYLSKNNIRINIIYNDAHLNGKFIENKHSAEFKFETL